MRHILRRSHRPVMLHIQRQQAQCEMRITGVLQGSQQMRQQTKILTLRSQNDQPPALEFRDIQLTVGQRSQLDDFAVDILPVRVVIFQRRCQFLFRQVSSRCDIQTFGSRKSIAIFLFSRPVAGIAQGSNRPCQPVNVKGQLSGGIVCAGIHRQRFCAEQLLNFINPG